MYLRSLLSPKCPVYRSINLKMETYGSVCGVWLPCSVQGVWGKRAPPFGNKWHDNEPDKVWEKSHWHISRKKGPKEDSEFDYNVPPHQNSNPSDEVKKKKKKTSSYFILYFLLTKDTCPAISTLQSANVTDCDCVNWIPQTVTSHTREKEMLLQGHQTN